MVETRVHKEQMAVYKAFAKLLTNSKRAVKKRKTHTVDGLEVHTPDLADNGQGQEFISIENSLPAKSADVTPREGVVDHSSEDPGSEVDDTIEEADKDAQKAFEEMKKEFEGKDPAEVLKKQLEGMSEDSTSAQILKALILAQERNKMERLENLAKFEMEQRAFEREQARILEELKLLKKLDNMRPDTYELHPADVINEEDYEDSTGEFPSVKKVRG